MLVLVVDSATPAITAAVVEVGAGAVTLRAERVSVDGRAHGELLAPGIEAVLRDVGAAPGQLAAIVAGVGPGPFTGLRVGLVTAAALADALRVPTYGVCSLDALGGAVPAGATTLAATDARRREVYWAVYRDGVRLAGPAVDRPGDLAAMIAGHQVTQAVGAGAALYSAVLGLPVLDEPRYPVAIVLAERGAGRVRTAAPGEPLTPLYLRRPDAVEPAGRTTVSGR